MPSLEVDFLIIGQGLAGSLLAFELLQREQKVMVIDNQHIGSSSQVAAGIINPITGHRLNLAEGFVANLDCAKDTYRRLEQVMKSPIFRNIEQHRLLKNAGQASYFAKRQSEPAYQQFLTRAEQSEFVQTEHGVATVMQTAVVDTSRLLKETKTWLQSINAYREQALNYQTLSFEHNRISIKGVKARKVIFCEGYQAINNPWLNDLPFKLSKGEILTLKNQHANDTMLNWGNWYLPQANGYAKLGSNYAWGDTTQTCSNELREKLLTSLEHATRINGSVTKHEVGIRPTTKFRTPFIGPISSLKNAYCFNGFGSKGCLTIPLNAINLSNHLVRDTPLAPEVTQWL